MLDPILIKKIKTQFTFELKYTHKFTKKQLNISSIVIFI